jgi:prepilin peptidase CpaA
MIEYGVLGLLLVLASWLDWKERRIPNWLCLIIAAAALIFAFATGGIGELGLNALHGIIALVGGMALFALRVVGAGDAKLYAAVASWFSLYDGLRLFVSVALAGLVLLMVWFVVRRMAGKRVTRAGDNPHDLLPYGIAISLGAMLTAVMNLHLV